MRDFLARLKSDLARAAGAKTYSVATLLALYSAFSGGNTREMVFGLLAAAGLAALRSGIAEARRRLEAIAEGRPAGLSPEALASQERLDRRIEAIG